MISRAHRFHGHSSLNFVYRHGKIARGKLLTIKYIKNKKRTSYRAAVVVSKKILKSAVARNRVRRRIFAQIRELSDRIHEPFDIIITVYSDKVLELTSSELHDMLVEQLNKAEILS